MAEILAWNSEREPEHIVRRIVEVLAAGQVVALPTETVYGLAANAQNPDAVARLTQSKGRSEAKPLTVALADPIQVLDWAPELSSLGRRLARRLWPGPLTLVTRAGVNTGRLAELPVELRARLAPEGAVGLRVPAHLAALRVLHAVPFPVVLTSANRSGEPAATTAEEVAAAVGEEVALILQDVPSYLGQASTVVRVEGERWTILREGAVSAEELKRLSVCLILFVCTGNTCRSPMAEALCKRLLADRLGCTPAELPERGFLVLSAGLAAGRGSTASSHAAAVVRAWGGDLSEHVTRPMTADLLTQADYLLTMTQSHLDLLNACENPLAEPARLLAPSEDISDPYGGDEPEYRASAEQIFRHVQTFVSELPLP